MSIRERQLPSGITVYEVRYRDGDRHRSRSFRDRGAARRFDDQLAEVRRNGEFEWEMRRRRLTLQHLVEDWWGAGPAR